MMKTLTGVAAAAAIALTAIAAPQPAQAHSGWVGPAIGGFAVGALVGSAVARPYYYGGGPFFFARPAFFGPGGFLPPPPGLAHHRLGLARGRGFPVKTKTTNGKEKPVL